MARTIGRRSAVGAKRSLLPSAVIACARIEETAYWLELLVEANIVSAGKLAPLRQEIDELTAIFVTIIKRSKQ